MNISVCMATYNGAKYVQEQLYSILDQLSAEDEVVIIDDCSRDNTIQVIESIADPRITVYKNEQNKGHVFSFGKAIGLTTKEIVFMSDQDDIWTGHRVEKMKNALLAEEGILLVSSNTGFIDEKGNPLPGFRIDGVSAARSKAHISNIIDIFAGKTNYYGCAMAFRSQLKKYILPIPSYVESHDLWIALAANIYKRNVHIDEISLLRRIHTNNASLVKRPLRKKLMSRFYFLLSIKDLVRRYKRSETR